MIRIGIVGCGRILAAHLKGYRLLREAGIDDFRITALCARKEDDARMYLRRGEGPPQRPPVGTAPGDPLSVGDEYLSDFQEDTDVDIFTNFADLAASDRVDGVNDFTTHGLHHQVATEVLSRGKHLMTQKPLAVSIRAGQRMCELAEANGCTFAVFENARFRPDTRQLRWLFDAGVIGEPRLIVMTNVGSWWAPNRIVAQTPWRHRLIEGGGISLDIGVHLFNHFRYVAGEITRLHASTRVWERERITLDDAGDEVQRITCDADDTLLATFETEQAAVGQLCASWAGPGGPLVSGAGRGTVYYGSQGRVLGDTVQLLDGSSQDLAQLYRDQCEPSRREREFPLGLEDSFALNQLDWLDAIRNDRLPETSGEEGLRDLAAAFSILESSHATRWIDVSDVFAGTLADYQQPINQHFGI